MVEIVKIIDCNLEAIKVKRYGRAADDMGEKTVKLLIIEFFLMLHLFVTAYLSPQLMTIYAGYLYLIGYCRIRKERKVEKKSKLGF